MTSGAGAFNKPWRVKLLQIDGSFHRKHTESGENSDELSLKICPSDLCYTLIIAKDTHTLVLIYFATQIFNLNSIFIAYIIDMVAATELNDLTKV